MALARSLARILSAPRVGLLVSGMLTLGLVSQCKLDRHNHISNPESPVTAPNKPNISSQDQTPSVPTSTSHGWAQHEMQEFLGYCREVLSPRAGLVPDNATCECLRQHIAHAMSFAEYLQRQETLIDWLSKQDIVAACQTPAPESWTSKQRQITSKMCKSSFMETYNTALKQAGDLCDCLIHHLSKEHTYSYYLLNRETLDKAFRETSAFGGCQELAGITAMASDTMVHIDPPHSLAIATGGKDFAVIMGTTAPKYLVSHNAEAIHLTELALGADRLQVATTAPLFSLPPHQKAAGYYIADTDASGNGEDLWVAFSIFREGLPREIRLSRWYQNQASQHLINEPINPSEDETEPPEHPTTGPTYLAGHPRISNYDVRNFAVIYKLARGGERPELYYHRIMDHVITLPTKVPSSQGVLAFATTNLGGDYLIGFNTLDPGLAFTTGWLTRVAFDDGSADTKLIEREGSQNPVVLTSLFGDALYAYKEAQINSGRSYLFVSQLLPDGKWSPKTQVRETHQNISSPLGALTPDHTGIIAWLEELPGTYYQLMAAFWNHQSKAFETPLRLVRSRHKLGDLQLASTKFGRGLITWQAATNLEQKEFAIKAVAWNSQNRKISRPYVLSTQNQPFGPTVTALGHDDQKSFVFIADQNGREVQAIPIHF